MLKFFTLIGFFLIYLSASAQKAFYYQDNSVDLNKFSLFYMMNSPMDAHVLTDPYLDKRSIESNNNKFFILYNELSLKNMTIIDGHSHDNAIIVNLYEGSAFDNATLTPPSYKKKKLKGNFLILDILNGGNETLVWRGWIDLKKIKATTPYKQYQKAICLILLNLKISPVVSD